MRVGFIGQRGQHHGIMRTMRTVQRALDELLAAGKVQAVGKARARRWMAPPVPGFPTSLLLPAALPSG